MSRGKFTMGSSGKNTRGSSNFPPNPRQWGAERNGLGFRARFGLSKSEALCPFQLSLPNVTLLATAEDLREFVQEELLETLFGEHSKKWSGMTIPCDGGFIVVMNETHAKTRQNATLMEEYFHIVLGHKPYHVGICPESGVIRREFERTLEVEAYHSAAAALVPYAAMREMVKDGAGARDVALHFEVSEELVTFRLKTCKLFRRAS